MKKTPAAVASIHLEGLPDWLEIGFGSLWVSNGGLGAVQRIDPDTNKVIAETLFVSPKTVEANLARAYRKLGISTRAELGAVLGRETPDSSPAGRP